MTDDKKVEFNNWLEEHITKNDTESHNLNNSFEIRTFHLGGSLAFKLALTEFNRLFEDEG